MSRFAGVSAARREGEPAEPAPSEAEGKILSEVKALSAASEPRAEILSEAKDPK